MFAHERQSRIEKYIHQHFSVSVKELSEHFEVSAMTIRRDLEMLEQKGVAVRVHGGVIGSSSQAGTGEEERAALNISQKSAIGEAASWMVEDGQTLFIDAGTTTIELAKCLAERRGLTVVTNSVKVLSMLADSPGINLIGVGGSVYGGAWSFVGSLAEAAIRRFHSDLAFLGITSLSLERGLTEVNYFEADIKSLIIHQSQRVIVLADSSKFEKVSPISVAPLTEINAIITDNNLPIELVEAYRQAGHQLMLADELNQSQGRPIQAATLTP
jgi:DeoR family fructose operon transcriptional repressor